MAELLVRLNGDDRIVNPDIRDVINRTLTLFVCRKDTLAALENLTPILKKDFVKQLLTPSKEGSALIDSKSWIAVHDCINSYCLSPRISEHVLRIAANSSTWFMFV